MKELNGFLSAAIQFAAVDIALRQSMEASLEKIAQKIEDTAKAEIGTYQDAIGPFPEWAELAESTIEDRVRHGYNPDDPLLRSGEFRDSFTHETEGGEAIIGSKDRRAPWFEFGTTKMEPRPSLGPAVEHNKMQIKRILGEAVIEGFVGASPIHGSLGYSKKIE